MEPSKSENNNNKNESQKGEEKDVIPTKDFKATSTHIVFQSEKMELKKFEGRGRGFLATEDLDVGEILLDEKPVSSQVWSSQQPNIIPDQIWNRFVDDVMQCSDLASTLHYDDERAKKSTSDEVDLRQKVEAQVVANVFRSALGHNKWVLQLFLQQSFFNHSCIPNAVAYRKENQQAIVVVIKPIKKSEEIFLCYRVDFYTRPTNYRQEVLMQTWSFQCQCPRCTNPPAQKDLQLTGLQKNKAMNNKEIEEMRTLYDEIINEAKPQNNNKWRKKCKAFLKNKLHDYHWRKIHVRNLFIEHAHMVIDTELLSLMETQLQVQVEFFPPLENNKIPLFTQYASVAKSLGNQTPEDKLRKIDPNYDQLLKLFKD